MNAPKQFLTAAITLALTGAANAQGPVRTAPSAADTAGSMPAGSVPAAQTLEAGPNGMVQGGMGSGEAVPGGLISTGQTPMSSGPGPRHYMRRDVSWVYIDRPKPRKVGIHDIITVVVDEKSEVTQNSRFNRTRNAIYTAQLSEWLRINSNENLDIAASKVPGINATLQSRLQSMGLGSSTEGMKYRIAATVVDILPNGTLILEAHKSIRTNTEVWDYSLTGRIRTQDVAGNNEVRSENIADLMISKSEQGKVYDSTKRGWVQRFYDFLLPF